MKHEKITPACSGCRDGTAMDFEIAMAFQPIVDLRTGRPFAHEALVRGVGGEGAATVLARVTAENRYAFDQRCRVAAIEGAVAAGLLETDARLSINFLPDAVYSPLACIQLTLRTAAACGLPTDRLIFEFTENEQMGDPSHVARIIETYQAMGFGTALDDFGAGYAGLSLLARFQPDIIKLDMELIRGVENSEPRRQIVAHLFAMCRDLGLTVIAEGVETRAELEVLAAMGIRYVQGFLLAKPAFQTLADVRIPAREVE